MTKQEEIREGIAKILDNSYDYDFDYSASQGYSHDEYDIPIAKKILSYLHSQGVVIKVERELPHIYDCASDQEEIGYEQAQKDMADYEAVESLI